MLLIKTDDITYDMLDAMTDLVLDVNEEENVRYSVPDDADYFFLLYDDGREEMEVLEFCAEEDEEALLSAELPEDGLRALLTFYEMGETRNDMPVAEITAFTSPASRRKGYFRLLFNEARKMLYGYSIRFALYEGLGNREALKSMGAEYDHDEFMMSLSLDNIKNPEIYGGGPYKVEITPYEESRENGAPEEGEAATPYGGCFYRISGERAYIFGVVTYESFQRKGHASLMLKKLFSYFASKDAKEVYLEVSALNLPAVGLYGKLGFEVAERLCYYYL